MDTRLAAVKSLITILEQNKISDEVINSYSEKVSNFSELINLATGTIKFKLALDFFIENISSRGFKKLSPPVKNILRAAIYELEYLKKPDYAVINSYVEISKKYDKNSSKFVNAVLRNFLRKRAEIKFPDIEENPIKSVSIKYSHPEWLVEKWIKTYGIDETIKICEFNNKIPVISIRINNLNSSKEKILDLFTQNNVEFAESLICEECLILHNSGNIKNLVGYKEGYWAVQGESSFLASKILDPQKEEKILDICAAPGGKTAHIADLMQNAGEITAVDISQSRIKKIEENCKRLGVSCVKTVVADAIIFSDSQEFDRILIDAPCSNTGVFSKRPDARWKRTPEDIIKLTKIQLEILQNASKLLKEGGVLVYSTCSIEPEENILLIQEFLKNNSNFTFENISEYLPDKEDKSDGFVQILQSKQCPNEYLSREFEHEEHIKGGDCHLDGFFIAKLKKL